MPKQLKTIILILIKYINKKYGWCIKEYRGARIESVHAHMQTHSLQNFQSLLKDGCFQPSA